MVWVMNGGMPEIEMPLKGDVDLERFGGVARLYGPGDFLRYDLRARLFALPGIFGTTPATVPVVCAPTLLEPVPQETSTWVEVPVGVASSFAWPTGASRWQSTRSSASRA